MVDKVILATNGITTKMNGHPSSSTGSINGSSSPNVSANKMIGKHAPLKRPLGGITVKTVKRTTVPARPSLPTSNSAPASTNGTSTPPKRMLNALPEEMRRRIEEARLEKERKRMEEEERLKPKKTSEPKAPRNTSKPKKKKIKRHSSDEESDDDLFSGTSTPKSSKSGRGGKFGASGEESSCYKRLGRFGVKPHYLVPRDLLDGNSFSGSSSDSQQEAIQSSDLLQGKVFGTFFHGLEAEPRVRLEYPADGCSEEFILLVPKDRDEYDPISDLLRTVRCIVEFYLTPEQRDLFGSLDSLETSSAAGNLLTNGRGSQTPAERRALSPISTAISSREGTPGTSTTTDGNLTIRASQSVPLSPARSAMIASATAASSPMLTDGSDTDPDPILRSFTKARNRRDGPLFLRSVERFNTTLRSLKETGKIRENVEAMSKVGVDEGIWRCIQEQCYARTVAPRVEELSKYEAFSDNVYGELLPRFMSEIAQLTNLGPNSVFVDLGSGVGNLLIQVGLQTGSEAYGCEMMSAPSELASLQVAEAERRWGMWGLKGGKTEAWQGDFGEDERVRDVLRKADMVLVNNYAFTAPTNDKLSLQFLDLKDGAHIVSLKPFVPPDFRLTERTLSSPLAILRVAQRLYTSGCVSWADGGGKYYIHTVDRTLIAKFLEDHEEMSISKKDVRKRQWKSVQEESDDEE